MGGAIDGEGKSAKSAECMADAGARSQGAMAGSAIAAGVGVPAAMSIPYVGWTCCWLGNSSRTEHWIFSRVLSKLCD